MIDEIKIKNFKCFEELEIKLSKLTVLMGENSGGKSSFIQSFILFYETMTQKKAEGMLDLMSGKHLPNLYSFEEILWENAEEEKIDISVSIQNLKYQAEYTPTEDKNNLKYCVNQQIELPNIYYLDSDRRISDYQVKGNLQQVELGENNKYLAYILEKGRGNKIPISKERNLSGSDAKIFDIQVNEWLDYILPGSKVTVGPSGNDGMMFFLFGDENRQNHKTNVGYGVSFVLPIIMAGLLAKENDILFIENPELHLHPHAQTNLAAFLAVVAKSGVQVVVETHSDHIINGVRKSILKQDIKVPCEDILIYYFDLKQENIVQNIQLDENANVNNWPEGFMDQTEQDLYEIRKLRKQNETGSSN